MLSNSHEFCNHVVIQKVATEYGELPFDLFSKKTDFLLNFLYET